MRSDDALHLLSRTRRLLVASACLAGILVPAAPAAACSQQARVDKLVEFSDAWSGGDLTKMTLDRPNAYMPFGMTLPRRQPRWPRELQNPPTWELASIRAWLRRRVHAGERVTILRVKILSIHKGLTTGILSFRRTAPDIRGGHKIYGIAKFGARCGGAEGLSSGRSWWTWTKPISVCHPGKLIGNVRFCGRLP